MDHTNTPSDANGAADAAPAGTPRSVADEAALLVDLLAARGWNGGSWASGAGPNTESPDGPRGSDSSDSSDSSGSSASSGQHQGPCTCGGQQPAACRLCPVCQLIAFVQGISPETIERVAEVVDLAAIALRDLATTQRERRSAGGEEPS